MSAYITTDFTSPKAIHTACTDSSSNFNVLLIYLFLLFFLFVLFSLLLFGFTTEPHSQHMFQQNAAND